MTLNNKQTAAIGTAVGGAAGTIAGVLGVDGQVALGIGAAVAAITTAILNRFFGGAA